MKLSVYTLNGMVSLLLSFNISIFTISIFLFFVDLYRNYKFHQGNLFNYKSPEQFIFWRNFNWLIHDIHSITCLYFLIFSLFTFINQRKIKLIPELLFLIILIWIYFMEIKYLNLPYFL
ncbi:MAG: hypothetical protein RL264_203 [Bacteroidota bacterium]|jgi:hypothetical protein